MSRESKEKFYKEYLEGTIKDLIIIEPSDKERQFYKGEKKVLKYKLRNDSYHPLEDVKIVVSTILKINETESKPTKGKYIKNIDYPATIPGNTTKICKVTVDVPLDYHEMIEKNGRKMEWPFRVHLSLQSLKKIEEI